MGHGLVWTWVRLDKENKPEAVGISFTETALSGLPTEKPDNSMDGYEFTLSLPKEVRSLPFDHVAVDWNPKGHIPPGIYDVPHFDFHFYMCSTDIRKKIVLDAKDMKRCQEKPDSDYLPEGYIYAPQSEIKYMGAHWVDLSSPEFNGKPFTHTFIYGSYDGKVVFIEPMITLSYLLTKPSVTAPIKQPRKVHKPGFYYPSSYSVRYDEVRREYTIALEGFVKR